MPHLTNVELALAALLLEAAIGYPPPVYRAIGHPVTWMGALLGWLEARLNRDGETESRRRLLGVAALAVLLSATAGVTILPQAVGAMSLAGTGLLVVASSSLIAQNSLHDHVRAVADALEHEGLEAGRREVAKIVGRNPAYLDEAGVARAAIESLAENFADGVVAPAFWLAVAGLPGGALYKAINTADSMIGHRTPRYAAFGWAAARLDDLVNLPASRFSALLLVAGAGAAGARSPEHAPTSSVNDFKSGLLNHARFDLKQSCFWQAARACWRDASGHRSPNAGWAEAAMAGALGLRLAGPRVYGEERVDDAYMGDGRRDAGAADIRRALRIYRAACSAGWLVLLLILILVRF